MGIGGGIFLIALGAILAFALKVEPKYIDLEIAGWVLMLAGAATLVLTIWFWSARRRRGPGKEKGRDVSVLEETRIAHSHAVVDPEPPGSHLRPPPEP
jgi:hypothetical protein